MRVIGRAPDGKFMTTWKAIKSTSRDVVLYHIDDNGEAKDMQRGALEWGTWLDDKKMFAQFNFEGSPSGTPVVLITGEKNGIAGENVQGTAWLYNNKLLGERTQHEGFLREFSHSFLTSDGKCIVLPTKKVDGPYYQLWTYVALKDLSQISADFPGLC